MLMFARNKSNAICHAAFMLAVTMLIAPGCTSCHPGGGAACGPSGCSDMVVSDPACSAPMASCNAPMACDNGMCGAAGYDMGCGTEGCVNGAGGMGCGPNQCVVPHELRMTALPEYRIEPPDVILIEASNNLRVPTAGINAGESLFIQCAGTIPTEKTDSNVVQDFNTINGLYVVGNDGYINLGPSYGKVLCDGLPVNEIQGRVQEHLEKILTSPQVLVTLPDPTTSQIVAGPHLVRPDGTVGLGIYGSVFIAGQSLSEAKATIERHLSAHIHAPEVTVDVLGYNSKVYYVIADGAGAGEKVYRIPCTGNDTVLSAISRVNGLPSVSCRGKIWIARPSPENCGPDKLLHVDWDGIAQGAQTATNYQIFPGDRLYVKADPFITFDTKLSKVLAPIERVLGYTILGTAVVRSIEGDNQNGF